MKHPIFIIAAADEHNGIGKNGVMPWHFKRELGHFHDVTEETKESGKQNMMIMGRTTWLSLPEASRPLPNRLNVVLSHIKDFEAPGAGVVFSFDEAFKQADETVETIFIIGGGSVYAAAIKDIPLDGIYLTKIMKSYDCDTFFPAIPPEYGKPVRLGADEEQGVQFKYYLYKRKG